MTKKEREYANYIEDHVSNVYKAFQLIGDELRRDLSFDELELVKRINTHDASKWSEEEFEGYRQWFFPEEGEARDKNKFLEAWNHHFKNNDHHHEFYVFTYAYMNGKTKYLAKEMPDAAIAEMMCDWAAMSMHFNTSLKEWYKNTNMLFNDLTLKKINRVLLQRWADEIHKR